MTAPVAIPVAHLTWTLSLSAAAAFESVTLFGNYGQRCVQMHFKYARRPPAADIARTNPFGRFAGRYKGVVWRQNGPGAECTWETVSAHHVASVCALLAIIKNK